MIVKIALGQKILKTYEARELEDSEYRPKNIIYLTNHYNITNDITNLVTNYIFLTNYVFLTNYAENSLTNLEKTIQQSTRNNIKLSLNFDVSYAFENLYLGYKVGIRFRLFEDTHLYLNLGKL